VQDTTYAALCSQQLHLALIRLIRLSLLSEAFLFCFTVFGLGPLYRSVDKTWDCSCNYDVSGASDNSIDDSSTGAACTCTLELSEGTTSSDVVYSCLMSCGSKPYMFFSV
jgi:hypothetical protein